MGVFEVPATDLIKEIAKDFKGKLQQPEFVRFVKTGCHRERAPQNPDWWFERSASILYRTYVDGPVGTESLRTYYGGRKNRGVKPEHFRKASGKVIRTCLQALEKEGLIKKAKPKGRQISPKGQSYLSKKAKEVSELMKTKPKKERVVSFAEEKKGSEEKSTKDALRKAGGKKEEKEKVKTGHKKKKKEEETDVTAIKLKKQKK